MLYHFFTIQEGLDYTLAEIFATAILIFLGLGFIWVFLNYHCMRWDKQEKVQIKSKHVRTFLDKDKPIRSISFQNKYCDSSVILMRPKR